MRKTNYVGLDVHKKYIDAAVLDEDGRLVKNGKFEYTQGGFKEFFDSIDDAEIAMEASYCWQPAYDLLEKMEYDVELAHPLKTRLIADVKIKTDERDSEALAQLLKMDWLPTSYVPPMEVRRLREITRLRAYLVGERTRFKNKVHAALITKGIRLKGNIFAKHRREFLKDLNIETVNRSLSIIDALDKQIKEISSEIKHEAGESEKAKWLMSIPGVGYYSAVTILAEVGDISRFDSAENLCSYAGIVPSTHQSGGKSRHGRITKQGSPTLRWILEQCVWSHIRWADDTSLTRFFHRLAKKKDSRKAALATARKLLKVMYALLKEGREFRSFND